MLNNYKQNGVEMIKKAMLNDIEFFPFSPQTAFQHYFGKQQSEYVLR